MNVVTFEYKGYYGTVEYSKADNTLYGQVIGIDGLISYEGDSLAVLKMNFDSAIDDYIEMCQKIEVLPQKRYNEYL